MSKINMQHLYEDSYGILDFGDNYKNRSAMSRKKVKETREIRQKEYLLEQKLKKEREIKEKLEAEKRKKREMKQERYKWIKSLSQGRNLIKFAEEGKIKIESLIFSRGYANVPKEHNNSAHVNVVANGQKIGVATLLSKKEIEFLQKKASEYKEDKYVIISTGYGINRHPDRFYDSIKGKELDYKSNEYVNEVINFYDKNATHRFKSREAMAEEFWSGGKNLWHTKKEVIYVIENEAGIYEFGNAIPTKYQAERASFRLVKIDTTKLWVISEYDGAEGIDYFEVDEKTNELIRVR